jgi:predicted ATPase
MGTQLLTAGKPRSFFGRQEELSELKKMLSRGNRLISIVAPGGYGKSRLAEELCQQEGGKYANGCIEVELAPLFDAARIPSATARALGLKLAGGRHVAQQVLDYLREKEFLLHFDNFEHLLEGAPFVHKLLAAAPKLRVLVTSRERLGLEEEEVFLLGPLHVEHPQGKSRWGQLSAAVELFVHRAGMANGGFFLTEENAAAVANICTALDGVPLAIELAAAWSSSYGLAELQHELTQQLDITARDTDVPQRHRSVRASCDWSYGLLKEEQRLVLRCISVFKGGFFAEAAKAVIPALDLQVDLQALMAKSWLYLREILGQPRFQVHDAAIREYCFQRLLTSDDFDVAHQMHCRYFAGLLAKLAPELRGAGQVDALSVLVVEQSNLFQALQTALQWEDTSILLEFANHLHTYLLMVGEAHACHNLSGAILRRAIELDCLPAQQGAQLGLSGASMYLANYEEARQAALAAREIAVVRQDPAAVVRADIILGEVARFEGDHADARRRLESARDQARLSADSHSLGDALLLLGRIEMIESNFELARELIHESQALLKACGDSYGAAICLADLGNIEYRTGCYGEARRLCTESLELRRRLGDRQGMAQSLNSLGNVEFSEYDYSAAWSLYSESLEIKRDIGERFGIAATLNNLGNVEYCAKRFTAARALHEEGLALKREIGDRIGISYSLNNLGNISVRLGEYGRACSELSGALVIAQEFKSKLTLLAPLAISACMFAECGNLRLAGILAEAAARYSKDAGIALDPMDGGMLAQAQLLVKQECKPGAQAEFVAAAAAMDLDAVVSLALTEIAALYERETGLDLNCQDSSSGAGQSGIKPSFMPLIW